MATTPKQTDDWYDNTLESALAHVDEQVRRMQHRMAPALIQRDGHTFVGFREVPNK